MDMSFSVTCKRVPWHNVFTAYMFGACCEQHMPS